ncbi:MarR family transcriptional regulator [Cetobacterium somerae]|uniref:MarR family winged helix-turn-helix transcriptional regulator n=1 Tax=Cetobacterium TaxID=180162 RepID=UPI001F055FE6|nr:MULTISPECIES: MarR family transcriptional regulator [Cetobacterium]MCX3065896.1 MarR family transcriptional regulator [Cetobacterium somerae]UPO98038.1 MarR family transcriptional regulator [Cetobacterium somerae]
MKEILREIGMISRCCATISDIEFKEINLSKGQYLYLVRIYENPGIIQDKVASLLKVDRSTAAKSIKKLVEHGLVKKEKDEHNKKELKLYCTEKGAKLYPFLQREEEYSTEVITENITQDEIEITLKVLYKMRINIEKEWENMKKGIIRRY